jgi:hypothetical protein
VCVGWVGVCVGGGDCIVISSMMAGHTAWPPLPLHQVSPLLATAILLPHQHAPDPVPCVASMYSPPQVAMQQADYVAWNVWASINGKALLRFNYQHLGSMMSLGSMNGAVSLPIALPPPLATAAGAGPVGDLLRAAGVKLRGSYGGSNDGVTLGGPLAAALRRAAYLYRQPTGEQQLRVLGDWARGAAAVAQAVLGSARGGAASGGGEGRNGK